MGAEAGREARPSKTKDLTAASAAKDLSPDDLDLLVISGGFRARQAAPRRWHPEGRRDGRGGQAHRIHLPRRLVPISAGIVEGRRVTSVDAIADDLRNAGAEWEDAEVVVDGASSRRADRPTCPPS